MNYHPYKKKQGFTLIELTMVLVIIGLIVGAVLVGQDLIYAAKVRKEISKAERFDATINTFRLKYNSLPGDMRNPEQFGLSASGTGGDGDRKIRGTVLTGASVTISGNNYNYSFPSASGSISQNHWDEGDLFSSIPEWAIAQLNLSNAGLLSEDITEWANLTNFDANRQGGTDLLASEIVTGQGANRLSDAFRQNKSALIFGYEFNNRVSGHFYRPGIGGTSLAYSFVTAYLITPEQAKQIDEKYDDGNPLTGSVMAAPWIGSGCTDGILGTTATCNSSGGNIGNGSNNNRCLSDSTQDYDLDYDFNTCALRLKANF